jgi:hypothetical protein
VFNDVMGSEVSGAFNEIRWSQMVDKIADAYRLDKEERQQLRNNKAARLVAGLPFVAGCREPLRTGLSHLSLFVLASTEACRHDFDHKPADNADPLIRLKPISHFIGGDDRCSTKAWRGSVSPSLVVIDATRPRTESAASTTPSMPESGTTTRSKQC